MKRIKKKIMDIITIIDVVISIVLLICYMSLPQRDFLLLEIYYGINLVFFVMIVIDIFIDDRKLSLINKNKKERKWILYVLYLELYL